MSCPFAGQKKKAAAAVLPDVTGEHGSITARCAQLLPDCSGPERLVAACRDEVSRRGSGHCAEQAMGVLQCAQQRAQASRLIRSQCGELSHPALQLQYAECLSAQSSESPADQQRRCLGPLRQFLECASSVRAGTPGS